MSCEQAYKEYEEITIERPFPVGNPEGGVTFTLRSLTDAEVAESVAGVAEKRDSYVEIRMSDREAIYCALGGKDKIGREGWNYKEPLSLSLLNRLTQAAVTQLSAAVAAMTYPSAEIRKNSEPQ